MNKHQITNLIYFIFVAVLFSVVSVMSVSAQSAQNSFTESLDTYGVDTTAPSVPTGLYAVPVSPSQIDLSWSPSTDDFALAGYVVYRDGTPVATTTNISYVDSFLVASTTYSYAVLAFDTSSNHSALSAPVSTTTLPAPIVPPTSTSSSTTGGGASNSGSGLIYDIHISADSGNATVSFMTSLPAGSTVSWGLTPDYEAGSIESVLYETSHQIVLSKLIPETHYYVRITTNAANGAQSSVVSEFNTAGLPGAPLANPSDFSAIPGLNGIDLSWVNTNDQRATKVRIIRSDIFFPRDQFDGAPVYEGAGQSFHDASAVAGKTYYYAIFSEGADGLFSSGALAKARMPLAGEAVSFATSSNPFAGITFASNIDPMITRLSLADFQFIQESKELPVTSLSGKSVININGQENLTIRLPYNAVPQILKTIAVTLNDPTDPSKAFIFLLRANDTKTYYEASIGSLGHSGTYPLTITILDYQNQGLKQLSGSLTASVIGAVSTSRDMGQFWFWLITLIILALLIIPLAKKRKSIATAVVLAIVSSLFGMYSAKPVDAAYNPEINYQGKLANPSNMAVGDGSYNMEFKLYTSATGGTAIWTEDDLISNSQGVSLKSGLFSVMLGSTTPLTSVNFNQTLYLGVNIGGTASSPTWDGEMTPRKIIGTVPSAFYAGTSTIALSANTLQNLTPGQFFRNDITNSTSSATTSLSIVQLGAGKIAEFFGAAAQSVLSILSNGNVGIGSSTPSTALVVSGTATVGNIISTTTATSTFAGAVGIGTTSPSNKLEVAGNGYFSGNLTGANITATGTLTVNNSTALNGAVSITPPTLAATTTGYIGTNGVNLTFNGAGGQSASTTFNVVSGGVGSSIVLNGGAGGSAKGGTTFGNVGGLGGGLTFVGGLGGPPLSTIAPTPGVGGSINLTGGGGSSSTGLAIAGGAGGGFTLASGMGGNAGAANSAGGNSGAFALSSANGGASTYLGSGINTSGSAGSFSFTSGSGGTASNNVTNISGSGGAFSFLVGGSGGTSGNNATNTASAGANMSFTAGAGGVSYGTNSTNTAGAGGNLILSAGAGNEAYNGTTNIAGAGGTTIIKAGNAGLLLAGGFTGAKGGDVIISAGNGTNYTGYTNSGGSLYLYGGLGSPSGTAGNVLLGISTTSTAIGNVGIGTTSPSNKLEVAGNGYFSGNLTGANITATGTLNVTGATTLASSLNGLLLGTNGVVSSVSTSSLGLLGSSTISALTTNYLSKWGGSSFANSLIYDNGTNVGIGSTSPMSNLSVVGSGVFTGGLNVGDALNAPIPGGMRFARSGTNEPYLLFENGSGLNTLAQIRGTNGGGLHITDGGAGTSWFDITNNGNVGIGTTSPSNKLEVAGNGYFSGNLTGANITATGTLNVTGATTLASSLNGFIQATNGILSATTSPSINALSGILAIAHGGTGTSTAPGLNQLLIGNGSGGYNYISTSSLGISGGSSQWTTSGSNIYYNGGNVGIGATAPSNKLQVAGNGYFTGDITGANITATGTLSASSASFPGSNFNSDGSGTLGNNTHFDSNGILSVYHGTVSIGDQSGSGAWIDGNGNASFGNGNLNIDSSGDIDVNGSALFGSGNLSVDTSGNISGSGFNTIDAYTEIMDSFDPFMVNFDTATPTYIGNTAGTTIGFWMFDGSDRLTDTAGTIETGDLILNDGAVQNCNSSTRVLSTDSSGGVFCNTPSYVTNGISFFNGTSITSSSTLVALPNGNVGIGTTTPFAKLSITGSAGGTTPLFAISTTTAAHATTTVFQIDQNGILTMNTPGATSTITGNLYVHGALRSTTSYNGDLFFANNFSFTEADLDGTPQGLLLKNQNGSQVLSVDENGNLTVPGDICSNGSQCWGKSMSTLSANINAAASSTDLSISDLSASIASTSQSISTLSDEMSVLSSTTEMLRLSLGVATSTIASTTAIALSASQSFIQSIATAVLALLQSSGQAVSSAASWTVGEIHATLAVFTDVKTFSIETQTASVTNGLEMTDSATGQIYCVRITNGNFDKTLDSCGTAAVASTATTTTTMTNTVIAPMTVSDTSSTISSAASSTTQIVTTISTTTSASTTAAAATATAVATSTSADVATSSTAVVPSNEAASSTTSAAPDMSATVTSSSSSSSASVVPAPSSDAPVSTVSVSEPTVVSVSSAPAADASASAPATASASSASPSSEPAASVSIGSSAQ